MSEEDIVYSGFRRPKKNYFPMPNEWINICAKITSLAELKVIQYVLRHTWGFQEYGIPKVITTDEFMHGRMRADGTRIDDGTGLSNRSVIDGLKLAVKHGYLTSDEDRTDKARISKAYALKMIDEPADETPVKNVHRNEITDESDVKNVHRRYEDTSQEMCTSFTGDVKNVHSGYEEGSHRSEKDTLEKHLEKNTKEIQVSENVTAPLTASSHDEDAHASQQEQHETLAVLIQAGIVPQETASPIATAKQEPARTAEEPVKPATRKPRTQIASSQPATPELSAEGQFIIERWQQHRKKPIPLTKALIEAANQLGPCNPSVEDLKEIELYCYQKDKWYQGKGVKLWDIAREYEGWLSMQEEKTRQDALTANRISTPSATRPPLTDLQAKNKALREKYGQSAKKEVAQ